MTAVAATLAGVNFNGAADVNGTQWLMEELEGYDSPPVKTIIVEGTNRNGGVVASALLGPRPMTIRGLAKATSEANFWTAYDGLSDALGSFFATQTLQVTEGGSGVVKRLGVITATGLRKKFHGTGSFRFEIPLMAPDPLKYSDALSTTALPATVVNTGNFETYPVITLTAGGNYVLANTTQGAGAVITITGAPAGTLLDLNNRTAYSGATDVYNIVASTSVWWALLPGNNVITKTGGAADISWRNAWL